jgi:choline kinase
LEKGEVRVSKYKEINFDVRVVGIVKVSKEWADVFYSFSDEEEAINYLLRLLFLGVDIKKADGHCAVEGEVAGIVDIDLVEASI